MVKYTPPLTAMKHPCRKETWARFFGASLFLGLCFALLLSCTSCKSAEEEAVSMPVSMIEIRDGIDSMSVDDFTECSETTEFVKLSVTGYGDIILRLHADIAPLTTAHFQALVSEGYYNSLTFHRVYKDLLIQGGQGDLAATVKGEFPENGVPNHFSHVRGVLSMARTTNYDSATSEFFICLGDATFLDGSYAAFGYVIAGLSTVDKIAQAPVEKQPDMGGELSLPTEPVVIQKACFVKPKAS